MRAIAHGWTPSRAKNPPSRAVAQEFVDADRKYSGGFAENRYWTGGLAAMDQVNAGLKGSLDTPFQAFEEGGYTEAELLGSARGGHVNYYQEGGAARPGHEEGPNPFEGKNMPNAYARWERENHIDPPPPPEVAEEVEEEGGVAQWLRSLFAPDPETAIGSGEARGTVEEQMQEMEQAYGGRVGYQAGGLAVAAPGRILPPAGGVPPWIEPVGSGPGFMDEPEQGYQFGGMAARMGPAMRMARGIRGGGGQYRGVPPQRGGLHPGARQPRGGGLAAMMQQRGALHPGAQGPGGGFLSRFAQQSPGQPLHPGAQGPGGGGFMSRLRQMVQQQRAQQPGVGELPPGFRDPMSGGRGGQYGYEGDPSQPGYDDRSYEDFEAHQRQQAPDITDEVIRSRYEGRNANQGAIYTSGPGRVGEVGINPPPTRPFQPPVGRRVTGGSGQFGDPYQYGRNITKPMPGPGMIPPGGGNIPPYKQLPGQRRMVPPSPPEGGGIPGGPRVPPNMQGFLQRMRMQNRPPANVGGGANRVGMQDQQGGVARALQRGTGRPPMSRRMGFGRAGRRR